MIAGCEDFTGKEERVLHGWAPTSKESHGQPKIYCWMRVPLACKWGGIIVEKAGGGKIVRL